MFILSLATDASICESILVFCTLKRSKIDKHSRCELSILCEKNQKLITHVRADSRPVIEFSKKKKNNNKRRKRKSEKWKKFTYTRSIQKTTSSSLYTAIFFFCNSLHFFFTILFCTDKKKSISAKWKRDDRFGFFNAEWC